MRKIELTQAQKAYLIDRFGDTKNETLCEKLGISIATLYRNVRALGLENKDTRVKLTDKEMDYLVRHFKDTDNEYLAMYLGISESTLHRLARRFGLKKTRAHMRQMQREAAAAATFSNTAHGTYPPKGYRIPRSEEFYFKKGVNGRKRWGKAKERRRIEKAAAARKATVVNEKMRVRMGLPQLTKMKVTQQPRQQILDRCYLKRCGYILDESKMVAYWTPRTRRATRLEAQPVRHYRFQQHPDFTNI